MMEPETTEKQDVRISLDSAETHYNAGFGDGYRACVSDIAFFAVLTAALIVALRKLL